MNKQREIKFRAWDIEDKYMAYPGDCVGIDPKAETELMYCDMETVAVGLDGQIYLIDECGRYDYPGNLKQEIIIMQYTGLKDRNNVEIYEGDIVSIPYITPMGQLTPDEDRRAEVIFEKGFFGLKIEPLNHYITEYCEREKERYIANYGETRARKDTTILTVIGNIWEKH